jgi:hypothetical protein
MILKHTRTKYERLLLLILILGFMTEHLLNNDLISINNGYKG